jgi:hypothetical protein
MVSLRKKYLPPSLKWKTSFFLVLLCKKIFAGICSDFSEEGGKAFFINLAECFFNKIRRG